MIEFYGGFIFLGPSFIGDNEDDIHEVKQHVTDELSLMLGVAKPTALERILEEKRLKLVAVREREHRKHAQETETLVYSKREKTMHSGSHAKLTREQQEGQEKEAREKGRLEQKKKRLLAMPVPPTFMIRDGELQEDGAAVAAAPPWVTEIVGEALGAAVAATMKEQAVDAQLLKHLDHDAWKVLGVSDPIQRAKLVRRAQARNSVVPTPPEVRAKPRARPGKSAGNQSNANSIMIGSMKMDDISDMLDEITDTTVPVDGNVVHGAVGNGAAEGSSTIRPVEPENTVLQNLPGVPYLDANGGE